MQKKSPKLRTSGLTKKVFPIGTQKYQRVEQLRHNLDLSNAYIESAGLNETIAIIPVKSGFQNFYQKDKKSTIPNLDTRWKDTAWRNRHLCT